MAGHTSYAACEGLLKKAPALAIPEAMDADTYDSIMSMKGLSRAGYMDELEVHNPLLPFEDLLCPGAGRTYTPSELMLREDLSSNKVCWYADFSQDFWQFTKNANPLFALWCSHPLHPIARRERIIITVAQVVFVMMIASSIPRAKNCIRGGFESCAGTHSESLLYDTEHMLYANRDFCCLTQRMGLQWFLHKFGLDWGGGLYALVANIIFGQVLFQAGANCCCVQSHRKWVRVTCESIGHILIFLICILCCIPLPKFAEYSIAHHQVGFVLYTFVTGKIGAMLGTSIFQSILWYIFWRWQCPKEATGSFCGVNFAPTKTTNQDCLQSGFNISVLDYQAYVGHLSSEDEFQRFSCSRSVEPGVARGA